MELREALPWHRWEKEAAGERVRMELPAGLIFMFPISYIK